MNGTIGNERLLQFLNATPEQLELIGRILDGRILGKPEAPAGPPEVAPEGYLKKAEIAARLNKKLRTVDLWMAQGKVPFIKVNRSVLFRWSDVQAHLEASYRVCRRG